MIVTWQPRPARKSAVVGAVKWPSSSTTTQRGPGRACPVRTSDAVVTWGRCTPGIAGWRVEANVDPGLPNLADEPVSDGGIVLALGCTRGDQDLAAEDGRRLQERHLVATQCGHPRRLQSAHPASHHEHAPGPR